MQLGDKEQELSAEEFVRLHSGVFHRLSLGGISQWMNLDISMPQLKVMMVLYSGDHCTVTQVAEALHVSLPNVTGLVDRLVAQEMVDRTSDPSDRRVVLLALSPRGKQVLSDLFAERTEILHRIFARLSEEERVAVRDALQALLRALEEDRGDN